MAEVRPEEGGLDEFLLQAGILLPEAEQIDPLLELSQTENHQSLLYRLDLVAQGKVSGIDQLHQREGQGDIPGDDLGDLINIRLVPGDSDHQLEEVALHVVHRWMRDFSRFATTEPIVLALSSRARSSASWVSR